MKALEELFLAFILFLILYGVVWGFGLNEIGTMVLIGALILATLNRRK